MAFSYMLPAYMTRAAVAAGRYGPTMMKYGKRALSAGAFAAGMYNQFNRRKRLKSRGRSTTRKGSKSRSRSRKVKKRKIQWSGAYTGLFTRGTRRQAKVWSKQLNLGFVHHQEVSGQVNDPSTVYINVSSCPADIAIYYACTALCKMILRKKGFQIDDVNSDVYYGSGANNMSWVIKDENNNTLGTNNLDTTATIAEFAGQIQAVFNTWAAGDGGQPYIFTLYDVTEDTDGAITVPQFSNFTEIRLTDVCVHVKTLTEIKVQNRTLAEDSSAQDTNVLRTPVDGYVYDFPYGPRARNQFIAKLMRVNVTNGVKLVRAAELGSTGPRQDPAIPKYFSNCMKARAVVLQPGNIKKSKLWYGKTANLLNWLKLVRDEFGGGGGGATETNFSRFPHKMIALSDMINIVANTNKVTIGYEVCRQFGIYMTVKHSNPSAGQYDNIALNNTT